MGVVPVPDERLARLTEMYDSAKTTPAVIEFVDIAGLVRGASKGEGLGNKFLSHIREVDAICHVVRCFEDTNVVHVDGSIDPFHRLISSQDGALRNDGNQWYSPEEILHMDWLCDCVEGSIPTFDQLLPMSQAMVRLQGVYRDRIPPEKEGTLL